MNNGATAVWSGYNHQGKVGLLVALCEINRLISENVNLGEDERSELLDNWQVEFETGREDFDIVSGNITHSRHQVKAVNAINESNYAEVFKPRLKKKKGKPVLLEGVPVTVPGFDCGTVDANHRFLHVIRDLDISAWSNEYELQLYTYPADEDGAIKRFCDFSKVTAENDEVFNYAVAQIQTMTGKSAVECGVAWKCLQYLLSVKLSKGHRDGSRAIFNFGEMLKSLKDNDINLYDEDRLKRAVLEHWEDFSEAAEIDEDLDEEMFFRAKEYIERLYNLERGDFLSAIRLLHPNKKEARSIDDGLKEVVLRVVSAVKTLDCESDCLSYIKPPDTSFVLTTISNLDPLKEGSTKVAVKKIIRTVASDATAALFKNSKIINKSVDASFEDLLKNEPKTEIIDGHKLYNIRDYAPLSFVSSNTAISELNSEDVL